MDKEIRPAAGEAPAQTISWSPWLAVVFIIVVYFLSQFVGSLLISIYPAVQHWPRAQASAWLQNSVWAQFAYVVIAEGLTLGAIIAFMRRRQASFKAIGLRRFRWTDPFWGLAILPLYIITYLIVIRVAQALVPELNINQQQQLGFNHVQGLGPLIVTFISLVILPPIVEEIMMRGFLYTSLKKGVPQIGAAIITSVIFAGGHLQAGSGAPLLWVAFIDTFVLSLFLIYLREKTGGLYASMALHGLKNVIAFASIFIFHIT